MNDTYILIFPETIAANAREGKSWQVTVNVAARKPDGPTAEQIAASVREAVKRAYLRNS